jgi:hypothetical protein
MERYVRSLVGYNARPASGARASRRHGSRERQSRPVQGSLAGFIASEVEVLRPPKIALCHHDNGMPLLTTATDVEPVKYELERRAPGVELIEMPYLGGYRVLG